MITARYVQEPTDRIRRVVDLSGWLAAGETITAVSVAASPELSVTDVVVLPADNTSFEYFVELVEPGYGNYTIKFESTTSDGQVKTSNIEICFRMWISLAG